MLVDIAVTEALSVLRRRAKQRRTSPPDLAAAIAKVGNWAESGAIRWLAREQERLFVQALATIEETAGATDFNDALVAENMAEYGFSDAIELVERKRAGDQSVLDYETVDQWRVRLAQAFDVLERADATSSLPDDAPNLAELEGWLSDLRLREGRHARLLQGTTFRSLLI